MSKSPPPPYEPTLASSSSTSHIPLPTNPATAHLSSHLASLPALIRSSQQAHHTNRTAQEITLISLLTPPIASLLHAFATAPSLPPLAELTLVPAAAVPPGWSFTNPATDSARPRTSGEISRLERVVVDKPSAATLFPAAAAAAQDPAAEERSSNPYANPYFDDWGRWGTEIDGGEGPSPQWLWWNDEELAWRLARLLQPASAAPGPPAPPPPPPPPRESLRQARWSIFKSPEPLEPARQVRVPPPPVGVGMTVRVEEVTFRKENQLGIWESRNGFGIVVRVRSRW